jgi:hypothetical protein
MDSPAIKRLMMPGTIGGGVIDTNAKMCGAVNTECSARSLTFRASDRARSLALLALTI